VVARRITRRIPGLLIAVIIAIVVSWAADLASHGAAVLGPVPRGLPSLGLPALGRHDVAALLGAAVSMFVVILAQSAATSRAYAAKYDEEEFSEATDLVGLGAANAVALVTAVAVVVLGVEYGIALAIIASIVDHLRHSYSPLNSVLVKSPEGHWRTTPVAPGARSEEGLVVYRFGTSLYYANAAKFAEDVVTLAFHGGPLRWMILDCVAIEDIDYTASAVLAKVVEGLHQRQVRVVFSYVLDPVRRQLDGYGITATLGPGAFYETPTEALEAFHAAERTS